MRLAEPSYCTSIATAGPGWGWGCSGWECLSPLKNSLVIERKSQRQLRIITAHQNWNYWNSEHTTQLHLNGHACPRIHICWHQYPASRIYLCQQPRTAIWDHKCWHQASVFWNKQAWGGAWMCQQNHIEKWPDRLGIGGCSHGWAVSFKTTHSRVLWNDTQCGGFRHMAGGPGVWL